MGFFDGGNPPSSPDPVWWDFTVNSLVYAINFIYRLLQIVITFFVQVIRGLIQILVNIFHSLSKFLLHIWQRYIQHAIIWLASHVQKLRNWMKRIISPIIARLEKIKKWYDEHILKQQIRMIQLIQRIRQILGILRIFHVGWAQALDNKLADLQNRIQQSIQIVRGTLNQIINTLELAFDPTLLLRRNLLGASLLSNLGAIKRIFGYGDGRLFSASEIATIDRQHSLYFTSTVKRHLDTLRTSGPTQDDQDNRKAARQALADATNAPLPF